MLHFFWPLWQRGAKNWHANKFCRKRGPLFLAMTVYAFYIWHTYMHIEYDISASACRAICKKYSGINFRGE